LAAIRASFPEAETDKLQASKMKEVRRDSNKINKKKRGTVDARYMIYIHDISYDIS